MLILYIHGFLSSPQSLKARQVESFCQQRQPAIDFTCPFLPAYPQQAAKILTAIVEKKIPSKIGLIGSSLGGYYATYLSQRFNLPAVLVNPAVKPYEMMANYIGQDLKNYHTDDISQLRSNHVEEMRELEVNGLQYPNLLWLMAQTGDETLDYRKAVEKYQGCKMTIEAGGDHSFQKFEHHLSDILSFLQIVNEQ